MSVALSGELVFKVTFDQHGFPSWHVHKLQLLFICVRAQIHARSPFSNPNKPKKLENFKVKLISKKVI